MEESVQQWVRENITSTWVHMGINMHTTGTVRAHTDRTRDMLLIWFYDLGGPEVDTVYYQERGFPIQRKRNIFPKTYDELDEIQRFRLPQGRWVMLNTNVIHDVQNIKTKRISFQVAITHDCPELSKLVNE